MSEDMEKLLRALDRVGLALDERTPPGTGARKRDNARYALAGMLPEITHALREQERRLGEVREELRQVLGLALCVKHENTPEFMEYWNERLTAATQRYDAAKPPAPQVGDVGEMRQAIRAAGADAWDRVADPEKFIRDGE